jgi:O-antigen ligase
MVRETQKISGFIGSSEMLKISQFMSDLRQTQFVKNAPPRLEHVVVALLTLFIFVIPFHFNTSVQEISFYTASAIALFLVAMRKMPFSLKSPLTLPFALLVIWAFVGLFFALNKENSINDFYGHLIKYLILFYLILNFFDARERFLLLVWSLVISTVLFAAGLMIYFYGVLGHPLSIRLLSVNIPVNILSVVMVFPIILAANQMFRTRSLGLQAALLFGIAVIAMAVFLTASRFSVSITLLSLVILLLNHRKKAALLIILIAAMIMFLPVKSRLLTGNLPDSVKQDPRFFLSNPFFEMIKDRPITGIGFGQDTYADKRIIEKYNSMLDEKYRLQGHWIASFYYPHSIYIDIAARLGLVGLLIFFYFIFSYFRMGWRILRRSRDDFLRSWSLGLMTAFFVLLVIGVFESFLGFSLAVVLYIQAAMMVILWRLHGREVGVDEPV